MLYAVTGHITRTFGTQCVRQSKCSRNVMEERMTRHHCHFRYRHSEAVTIKMDETSLMSVRKVNHFWRMEQTDPESFNQLKMVTFGILTGFESTYTSVSKHFRI